jgi:hypothetical protein
MDYSYAAIRERMELMWQFDEHRGSIIEVGLVLLVKDSQGAGDASFSVLLTKDFENFEQHGPMPKRDALALIITDLWEDAAATLSLIRDIEEFVLRYNDFGGSLLVAAEPFELVDAADVCAGDVPSGAFLATSGVSFFTWWKGAEAVDLESARLR